MSGSPIDTSAAASASPPMLTFEYFARCLLVAKPHSNPPIDHVAVDSRLVRPGSLFVALPGERVDGHNFAAAAVRRGAVAILAQRPLDGLGVPVLVVKDCVDALRAVARAWRRAHSIPVIAVAGSVGKSTTKQMLAALVGGVVGPDAVLHTEGSQNGFIGLPLTLLRLRAHHRAAIVEIGIDEPGAMAQHLETAGPNHAIVTAIGPEHLDRLGSVATVAQEESLALHHVVAQGGRAAFPLSDPWLAPLREALGAQAIPYALADDLHTDAPAPRWTGATRSDGPQTWLALPTPTPWSVPVPLPGRHNALNLLGAIALARTAFDASPEQLMEGLGRFEPLEGRSQLALLPASRTWVLRDYYNASPTSVAAALQTLASAAQARRIAILGDMLELGADEERLHRALAGHVLASGVQRVWLVGSRMKWLGHALAGTSVQSQWFANAQQVADFAADADLTDTAVLIKGSRSIGLERVWHALTPPSEESSHPPS